MKHMSAVAAETKSIIINHINSKS